MALCGAAQCGDHDLARDQSPSVATTTVWQPSDLTKVISSIFQIRFGLFCCCLGDMHMRSHKFMGNLHLRLLALTDYKPTRERDKAWTLHVLLQFQKGMYSVLNASALA
jgi:hypothetical protein